MYAECSLMLHDCDIGMEMSCPRGTAIGSIGRSSSIQIYKTSVKLFMSGIELTGIGTLGGEEAKLELQESSCIINIKGERCAAIAALEGRSETVIRQASVRLAASGKQVLGCGGFSGDTSVCADTADVHITQETPYDIHDYLEHLQTSFSQSQFILTHNQEDVLVYSS